MSETLAHALSLCVWSVRDVELLIRLSTVSKAMQGICKSHVQQHLPMLLVSVFEDWGRRLKKYKVDKNAKFESRRDKALKWLYQSAGPANVGSPAAALTLLRMMQPGDNGSMSYHEQRRLRYMAVQHGMQITTDVLVAAAKARLLTGGWWDDYVHINKWRAEVQLSPLEAPPPHASAAARGKLALLVPLLPDITPQQMPDLLYLTVNNFDDPSAIVQELLQHDRQCTHVLHNNSSQQGTDGSGSVSSGGNSEMSSCSPTLLVEKLLATCIIREHYKVVQQLGDTPAAQALTTSTVLKLLCLAVRKEPRWHGIQYTPESSGEDSSSTVDAVCRLPAARSISAASIYNLINIAWKQGQYGSVGRLTTLAQAGQLTSEQLCNLLLLVGNALLSARLYGGDPRTHATLLQRLATLQSGQQLAPGDAYGLVKAVLDMHTPVKHPQKLLCQMLEELAPLNLGGQLTGSELLDLLLIAVKHGNDASLALVTLKPAADEIGDETQYTSLLKCAIGNDRHGGGCSWYNDVFNALAEGIPFTRHLGTESVAQLLHASVEAGEEYDFLWQLPALQQISADAVGHLFIKAAKSGLLHKLQPLWGIPAAAELTAELFQQLMHAALGYFKDSEVYSDSVRLAALSRLFAMPAAQQLTTESIASVLLQASTLFSQFCRPQCRANQFVDVLADFMEELLQLPASKQLALSILVQILEEAIAADNTKLVCLFSKVPVIAEMDDSTANQLLQAALERGDVQVLQTLHECLPQIAALAATLQPTGEQLKKQIACAIAQKNQRALAELSKHPKAADISPDGMAELLRAMFLSLEYPDGCWPSDCVAVQLLLGTQAAQDLGPSAVADLFQLCTRPAARANMMGISLAAQLPGAALVEAKTCEAVLDDIICPKVGRLYMVDEAIVLRVVECLLQLPQMQTMSAETVAQRLQRVAQWSDCDEYRRKQGFLVSKLMTKVLPGAQRLSKAQWKVLMQTAAETKNPDTFKWFFHSSAAAAYDDDVHAWGVLLGVTELP